MLNLDGLEIDRYKKKQMEEFLSFKLTQNKPLSFVELQRNLGLSRRQWEIFRSNNAGKDEVQWKNE